MSTAGARAGSSAGYNGCTAHAASIPSKARAGKARSCIHASAWLHSCVPAFHAGAKAAKQRSGVNKPGCWLLSSKHVTASCVRGASHQCTAPGTPSALKGEGHGALKGWAHQALQQPCAPRVSWAVVVPGSLNSGTSRSARAEHRSSSWMARSGCSCACRDGRQTVGEVRDWMHRRLCRRADWLWRIEGPRPARCDRTLLLSSSAGSAAAAPSSALPSSMRSAVAASVLRSASAR